MSDSLALLPLVLGRVPHGLRQCLAQEGVPHAELSLVAPAGRFVLFDATLGPPPALAPGQTALDIDVLRRGWHTDPFEALEDISAGRFGWRLGALTVCEEVARVDRRLVRERLMDDLRELIDRAGGVWLRLSAFPYPYRTAFNFRLDHDGFEPNDFDATLDALAGHEGAVSHYVCAATHADHPRALARLAGQHVGSHGFWHHTYREEADNRFNIRRGIEALRRAGLAPVGFAAPHGRFNHGLLAALSSLGITHSSEFGLAFDDLPFFPAGGNVLQLPVHPICLGIALQAAEDDPAGETARAAAADAVLAHFERVASEKRRAGEPILLYGHPDGRLGRYPHVLRTVLETAARQSEIWKTTHAALTDWWRARLNVKVRVLREGQRLAVHVQRAANGYRFAVEYWRDGRVATLPLSGPRLDFSPDAPTVWSRQPAHRAELERFECGEGVRAGLRRLLDWERVTPVGDISTRTWRGWAKRALRRIRS